MPISIAILEIEGPIAYHVACPAGTSTRRLPHVMAAISSNSELTNEALGNLSPMALADFMLLELIARDRGTLLLEPQGNGYSLLYDGGAASLRLATLPAELGEATIVRLALIADAAMTPPKVARIPIRLASHRGTPETGATEVLLSMRATTHGVAIDVHLLARGAGLQDTSAVAGLDGVPTPRLSEVKYQILGELGRGGMGIVYRARHVLLDKVVALKVLSPAIAQQHVFSAQFIIEARAACRARHPAIVDITDFGQLADGRHFLVMEYLDWSTLDERLASGPLAPLAALEIAAGIGAGLQAAHKHGVVHRDLKPSNIFVNGDNQVKIGDFGLAHSTDSSDGPSPLNEVFFGTVPYMAPELIRGTEFDHRADIYAFGCILHELFEGTPPYTSDSSAKILDRHANAPIPPLGDAVTQARPAIGRLHARLLAKDPGDRPSNFGEVLEVLRAEIEASP